MCLSPGPSTPRWTPPSVPKGSSWNADMRSRAPGVYNSYEQVHAQIHEFPGGKLSGHSAETLAHRALILWQSAYARFPAPDPARPLHRIYNDGSASGRQSAPPRRAGWGLTVLSSNQPEPHSDQYGPVITFSSSHSPNFLEEKCSKIFNFD